MKKITILLLIAILTLAALTACSAKAHEDNKTVEKNETISYTHTDKSIPVTMIPYTKEAVENAPDYDAKTLKITVIEDFDETIKAAHKAACPGDIVLMSPACASFDKFKNFAQRGEAFKRIVYEL